MSNESPDIKLDISWGGVVETKKPGHPFINNTIPAKNTPTSKIELKSLKPKLTLEAKEGELVDPFEKAVEKITKPETIILSEIEKVESTSKTTEKFVPAEKTEKIKEPTLATEKVFSKPIPIPKTPQPTELPSIPIKSQPLWKMILKFIGVFVGVLVFIYLLLNIPTFYEKIKFRINPPEKIPIEETTSAKTTKPNIIPVATAEDIYLSFITTAMSLPVNYTPPSEEASPPKESGRGSGNRNSGGSSETANNTLIIPRLGKKVPIVWNSPPDENTMLENLHYGVVHYAGTPLPGEGKGPIFITGHSSYYWWDKGKYKTVFANLDRLNSGDKIQIKYNDEYYTYEVFDKIVVMPDQVDVLTPTYEEIVDLMTCVPVGTNQKRLIVKAKRI